MSRAAIALLGLVGCNAVFGLDPVMRDDSGPPPGADAHVTDAAATDADERPDGSDAIDAGCIDDLDCDGVGDVVDRCPGVPDPAQHDEDGDGLGDVCDNCPGVPNPTQADTTEPGVAADGVGDACDPHPDARDRLVLFDPLTDAQPWTTPSGNAQFTSDDLQITGDTGGAVLVVRSGGLPPSSGHLHAMVAFTLDQFAPGMVGSLDRGVTLFLDAGGASGGGRRCSWIAANTRLTAPTLTGTDNAGTVVTGSPVTLPMTTGAITVVAGHQVPTTASIEAVHCYVRGATWPSTYDTGAANAGPFTTGTIALAAHRTALRYHWLAVYDHL